MTKFVRKIYFNITEAISEGSAEYVRRLVSSEPQLFVNAKY